MQLIHQTDPSTPFVADEIKRGIRQPNGETDVHHHLPYFQNIAHGNVLEIGVRFGTSTAAFLSGVEKSGGHLYSVDIDDCSHLFSSDKWTFIKRDSRDIDYLNIWLPGNFDVLYIDGDHSYEGVFADLLNFGPKSEIIICHDANLNENPQVLDAIGDYLHRPSCRQEAFSIRPESHGLAIIR
jgi:predicted O-methyltransferase YrrM